MDAAPVAGELCSLGEVRAGFLDEWLVGGTGEIERSGVRVATGLGWIGDCFGDWLKGDLP